MKLKNVQQFLKKETQTKMAKSAGQMKNAHVAVVKSTSQGKGGRGRSCKIAMSTMNKNKKRSYKKYRGQGR